VSRVAVPERCQVCGCTETNPCLAEDDGGNPVDACSWIDFDHTLCSNPKCVAVIPLEDLLDLAWLGQFSG